MPTASPVLTSGETPTALRTPVLARPLTPTPTREPKATPPLTHNSTHIATSKLPLTPTPTPALIYSALESPQSEELLIPTPWVRARLAAVVTLYHISPRGQVALESLDVRQMVGQPGWFGSYGYRGWTGVGEAKPIPVMHELSHAYWGAFPVVGRPDLLWDPAPGEELSSSMAEYHRDVLTFLSQPPDAYEPLRERLRLLPSLSSQNTDPLFHTVEADLIYMVGGDLSLVPPILRKYWEQMIEPGPFGSWAAALAWFQSLPDTDRSSANGYLGFEHFDLRAYHLPVVQAAAVRPEALAVLAGEERQRLSDFASQFDMLVGDPDKAEDFNFWRGYMRDMLNLRAKYPTHLSSLGTPRAAEIDNALAFLGEARGLPPPEASSRLAQGLMSTPFLAHFLPVVDDVVLLALFSSGAAVAQGATLKGTATFVEALREITPLADEALRSGRADPGTGAARLQASLDQLGLGDTQRVDRLLGIMADADHSVTRRIVALLDDGLLRRLLVAVPARLRSLVEPQRLAAALSITASAPLPAVAAGLREMVKNTAGNHLIDEPFLDQAWDVLSERSRVDPVGTLAVLRDSSFPMTRYVRTRPQEVVRILSSDMREAAALVAHSDTTIYPPALFVHDLLHGDPAFAATLVAALDAGGYRTEARESLAALAYDADRLAADASLPLAMGKDGVFLAALLDRQGENWLAQRLWEVDVLYHGRAVIGEVPPDFVPALQRTLDAAISTLDDRTVAEALERAVKRTFP